jgi:hypothetical protein
LISHVCHDDRRSPNPTIRTDYDLSAPGIEKSALLIAGVLRSAAGDLHMRRDLCPHPYSSTPDHTETPDRDVCSNASIATGEKSTERDRRVDRTLSERIFVKRGPQKSTDDARKEGKELSEENIKDLNLTKRT